MRRVLLRVDRKAAPPGRVRRSAWIGLAAVVAMGAVLAGCGSDEDASRTLERALSRLIGPAQHYQMRVAGASGSRLKQVKVRANRLSAGEKLVFDSAAMDLTEVRFDRQARELLGVERADFSAVLLQEDLNYHLQSRSSLMRGLRLRLTPNGAQLRGSADIPGVNLPVTPDLTLDGTLEVDDAGRLCFRPKQIRVVGIEVPAIAAQVLATQINPLVDLTGGRLPIYLRGFELDNGEVQLTGRALFRPGRYPELER